jgi:hypothetical protein
MGKQWRIKMNNAILMKAGMQALIEKLGNINAEKFISLLLREPFDYTEWRKENLFAGMTIEEISNEAMKLYNENHGAP